MDCLALLVITLTTNCNTSGSWANGDREQSCIVTRTVTCNHQLADGLMLQFETTEDYGTYSVKFNGAGQPIESKPMRLVVKPQHSKFARNDGSLFREPTADELRRFNERNQPPPVAGAEASPVPPVPRPPPLPVMIQPTPGLVIFTNNVGIFIITNNLPPTTLVPLINLPIAPLPTPGRSFAP